MSTLERGMKSPTLEKIEELASAMNVHPMTLLALTFSNATEETDADLLFEQARQELVNLDRK